MTKRTSGLAALAAVACLLGLAGCGSSDPSPATLPPASSTPASPSATPSATVEAQVEAAVRHYFDVASTAFQSGDTSTLEELSTPGCACRKLVKGIKTMASNGRHAVGTRYVVDSIDVHDVTSGAAAAVVAFHVTPYTERDDSGRVTASFPRHDSRDDLSLTKVNGTWLISNAVKLDSK